MEIFTLDKSARIFRIIKDGKTYLLYSLSTSKFAWHMFISEPEFGSNDVFSYDPEDVIKQFDFTPEETFKILVYVAAALIFNLELTCPNVLQ